ncbi:LOW QUALITY PROTEIN: Chromatin structure-remodeling complex subunit RSC1 [Purpureocillium lavendulum]|uniref:Chromatin structure-remodeling complex subunit RSC1 n=1 Tax=Purpureocillium lavendulum TaxID=1247861 RepID=A0AB34FNU8_9HYPO|nr:LOW QUALITY PROTEIN: Chromatin structure-remodeling complex subunit RSC1 [Purpureocillium lavendulum]
MHRLLVLLRLLLLLMDAPPRGWVRAHRLHAHLVDALVQLAAAAPLARHALAHLHGPASIVSIIIIVVVVVAAVGVVSLHVVPRVHANHAAHAPIALDALHQVLVRRPVHAAHALHHQLERHQHREAQQHRHPPLRLAAKVAQERVPHNARQDDVPEEPARDGDEEAAEYDDGLAVHFEQSAWEGTDGVSTQFSTLNVAYLGTAASHGNIGAAGREEGKTHRSFTLMKMTATVKQMSPMANRLVSLVKSDRTYTPSGIASSVSAARSRSKMPSRMTGSDVKALLNTVKLHDSNSDVPVYPVYRWKCACTKKKTISFQNVASTYLPVVPAAVHEEQLLQEAELRDRVVGDARRLQALAPRDADAHVRRLDHANVVGPVANRQRHTVRDVAADRLDQLGLLRRRRPAADDRVDAHHEVVEEQQQVVVGVDDRQRLPVHDEHRVRHHAPAHVVEDRRHGVLQVALDDVEDVHLGEGLAKPGRVSDVDGRLALVARDHPDLDVGPAQFVDGIRHSLLQLILDGRRPRQLKLLLDLVAGLLDEPLAVDEARLRLAVLLLPAGIRLVVDIASSVRRPSDAKSSMCWKHRSKTAASLAATDSSTLASPRSNDRARMSADARGDGSSSVRRRLSHDATPSDCASRARSVERRPMLSLSPSITSLESARFMAKLVRGVPLALPPPAPPCSLIRRSALSCSKVLRMLALRPMSLAFCSARWLSLRRDMMTLSAPLQNMQMRPSGMRMMMDMRFRLLLNSMTSRTWYVSTWRDPSASRVCSLMDCAGRSMTKKPRSRAASTRASSSGEAAWKASSPSSLVSGRQVWQRAMQSRNCLALREKVEFGLRRMYSSSCSVFISGSSSGRTEDRQVWSFADALVIVFVVIFSQRFHRGLRWRRILALALGKPPGGFIPLQVHIMQSTCPRFSKMVVVFATIGVSVTGSYMSTSRIRINCPILMISILIYKETGITVEVEIGVLRHNGSLRGLDAVYRVAPLGQERASLLALEICLSVEGHSLDEGDAVGSRGVQENHVGGQSLVSPQPQHVADAHVLPLNREPVAVVDAGPATLEVSQRRLLDVAPLLSRLAVSLRLLGAPHAVRQDRRRASVLNLVELVPPIVIIALLGHAEGHKQTQRHRRGPAADGAQPRYHLQDGHDEEVEVADLAELKDELLGQKVVDSVSAGSDEVADVGLAAALVDEAVGPDVRRAQGNMPAICGRRKRLAAQESFDDDALVNRRAVVFVPFDVTVVTSATAFFSASPTLSSRTAAAPRCFRSAIGAVEGIVCSSWPS